MRMLDFIHQKDYERIIYKVRRHPITLLSAMLGFLLLFAVPVAVRWLVVTVFPTLLASAWLYPLLVLFASVYYLSIGLFAFTYLVSYYLDVLIITNDRLLTVEQQGLFSRTIAELDLYKIQDVTSTIKGIFPSIFRYGDLLVETAGAAEEFNIEQISNPEALRQAIMDLADEDRKHHAMTPAEAQTGIPQ